MAWYSRFKIKEWASHLQSEKDDKKNKTFSSSDVTVTPIDTIIEKDDGTRFKKNSKGAWDKVSSAAAVSAHAEALTESRRISITGDATGHADFDGSEDISIDIDLTISNDDLDMKGNKVLFANVYMDESQLPDATTYHGMFAHVHSTGKAYYSHSGNWKELANASSVPTTTSELTNDSNFATTSQLFSGNYNDLANKPSIPTVPTNISTFLNDAGYITDHQDLSAYALKTDLPTPFSGNYNDLTNKPTIPSISGLASTTYVDTAISNLVNGANASFDTLKEIQDAMATDAELASAISALEMPAGLTGGTLDAATGIVTFTRDDNTTFTVDFSSMLSGSGATIQISSTAPTGASSGDLWWDDEDGLLNVYYDGVWVEASPASASVTQGAGSGLDADLVDGIQASQFLRSDEADTMNGNLSVIGEIVASGDVTAYSDDSLKTNIQPIQGALSKVEQVTGVTFERITDGSVSTGVVAQELEMVLPEAVKTDDAGLKHVAYGNITGLLIEAVKELDAKYQDQIKQLKNQIEEMKRDA